MNTNSNQSPPALQSPSLDMIMGGFDDIEVQRSCWERLPVEIMEDIFLMCRPVEKEDPPCKAHAPYLLTYVCRSWYKTVVELSKMWSTVVLTTANDSDNIPLSRLTAGARHAEMCIVRAQRAPIELYVRAEFITYLTSFEHIQRANFRSFTLIYPTPKFSYGLPSFFPFSFWALPNITTLEVHTQSSITESDEAFLNGLIMVRPLRKFVCVTPMNTNIFPRDSFPNMSNLEVLVLQECISISACMLILQNAPSLQQLSLIVEMYDELDDPLRPPTQSFVYSNLRYLALTYFESPITIFFDRIALPSLHFLVLSFEEYEYATTEAFWPHDDFANFLRRSGCKLKSFHVRGPQPIAPSELLELLSLPQLADSLKYLGIQTDSWEVTSVDDLVLEALTLRSSALQETVTILGLNSFMPFPPVLCPNIERLMLLVPLENVTISKLIAMFNSRLPSTSAFPHKPLRQVDMEAYEGMNAELEALQAKGLVLTGPVSSFMPAAAERQRLWRRYLLEGLDDEVYQPYTGTWSRDTRMI